MAINYHLRLRRFAPPVERLERDLDALRIVVIQLRHELQTKQTALGGLELALHQRNKRIDQLTGTIDRLRVVNQRLDAEAERYYQMLAAS